MDEAEILDMGRRLLEEHAKIEKKEKDLDYKIAQLQKKLALIYTFGRELDMLIDSESSYPIVIKYMVERLRGITSTLLFRDPFDELPDISIYIPT